MPIRLNITTKLALILTGFAAALLAVVAAFAFLTARSQMERAALAELTAISLEKSAALERWTLEHQQSVVGLGSQPITRAYLQALLSAEPGTPAAREAQAALTEHLRPVAAGAGRFLDLFVLDAQTGQVIAATNPAEVGDVRTDRLYFREGRLGLYIQSPYFSPQRQEVAMTVAAPIRTADGQALGVLAGRLNLAELTAIVNRRTDLYQTDDAFLVNGAHLIVTEPRFLADAVPLESDLYSAAIARCLEGGAGELAAADYRGVPAFIIYRWLTERELCLIVKRDQAEVLAPLADFLAQLLAASGGLLAAAVVLAVGLARTITRPVLTLQEAMTRFEHGERNLALAPGASDELGALTGVFANLSRTLAAQEAELRAAAERLEVTVAERTRALQAAHAELQALFAAMPDVILVLAADGRYLKIAPTRTEALWLPPAQLLGRPVSDFFPPEQAAYIVERVRVALAQRQTVPAEYSLSLDGRAIWFEASVSPLSEDSAVWVARDVTARRCAEAALRESEARYRTLFSTMREGFALHEILCDAAGQPIDYRFLDVNPAFEAQTGLRREQVVGRRVREVLPDTEPFWIETYGRVALSGEAMRLEHFAAVLGRHYQVDAFCPAHGQFAVLFSDITERKLAEARLSESEARHRALVNSMDDIVFTLDTAGRHSGVFGRWVEQAQLTPDFFLGKTASEVLGPAAGAVHAAANQRALAGERVVYEWSLAGPDGPAFTQTALSPLHNAEGEIVGLVGVGRDVTERRRAAEALSRQAEDLRRSNAELQQFAYVASHDLQEPLRMVASYVQLLARRYRGQLDADADEFIHYAVDGAERMKRLIEDLLAYSRVGTRGQPQVPTAARQALDQALANLRLALEEAGAEVESGPLPVVLVDPSQLVQVFQNLISNALKFRSAAPPRVRVTAERLGPDWLLRVGDNGLGIDPKYHDRIFIIFQRLHGHGEYPGTGIGLAICKKIVERHGGRIWVESQLGQGAVFCFTLPAAAEAPEEIP